MSRRSPWAPAGPSARPHPSSPTWNGDLVFRRPTMTIIRLAAIKQPLTSTRQLAVVAVLVGALALAVLPQTEARAANQDIIVNSKKDLPDADPTDGVCAAPGECTLRAAVMTANTQPGPDTIELFAPVLGQLALTRQRTSPSEDHDASSGDLDITDDLTIVVTDSAAAPDHQVQIIGGDELGDTVFYNDRRFHVSNGARLTLTADTTGLAKGLVLQRGNAASFAGDGGGILVESGGSLNITNAFIAGHQARDGGAIALRDTATLSLDDSIVVANAGRHGGGIHGAGRATLRLTDSELHLNTWTSAVRPRHACGTCGRS
jgi:CSLREA domain-containing protein